jgi:ribonuclease III
MTSQLGKLENLLGHRFKDLDLLQRAVTHRSWVYENIAGETDEEIRLVENESMEFLGDSVLGLIVAEKLFNSNPTFSEGQLTLMKHHLVSMPTLAKIAGRLELGDYVRFGKGEEKTGGRKKQALLANTFEAVIAAVFIDGGYIKARAFVTNLMADEFRLATPTNTLDYKSLLQELLQSQKLPAPGYKVVKTEGPSHARTFFVEASWENGTAHGEGNSRKSAEMVAAAEALKVLKVEQAKPSKRPARK